MKNLKIIQAKIDHVQNYFINQLVNGFYEVVKADRYIITMAIDTKYIFHIWIANGPLNVEVSGSVTHTSFMELTFTQAEKNRIWKNVLKYLNENNIPVNENTIY